MFWIITFQLIAICITSTRFLTYETICLLLLVAAVISRHFQGMLRNFFFTTVSNTQCAVIFEPGNLERRGLILFERQSQSEFPFFEAGNTSWVVTVSVSVSVSVFFESTLRLNNELDSVMENMRCRSSIRVKSYIHIYTSRWYFRVSNQIFFSSS